MESTKLFSKERVRVAAATLTLLLHSLSFSSAFGQGLSAGFYPSFDPAWEILVSFGGGRYYGWGGQNIDVHEYTQGTLILDFVDTKNKHLVWRGSAQGALPDNPTPEKIEKKINEAVAKLLEKFPPVPSS